LACSSAAAARGGLAITRDGSQAIAGPGVVPARLGGEIETDAPSRTLMSCRARMCCSISRRAS
jgi:hypothetical protein